MSNLSKILYLFSLIALVAGILSMFAAKIATGQELFLGRSEIHWFYDSITALLTSISLGIIILINKE